MDTEKIVLSDIIRRIVAQNQFSQKEAEEFAREINVYYLEGQPNLYSETYQWLTYYNEENFEYLIERLNKIQDVFNISYSKYSEKFCKLKDYVILEAMRASEFSDIKKTAEDAAKYFTSIKKLSEEIEENKKNSNAQSITVLSIFTGVAMAFFGGFSLLGSAFERLGQPGVSFLELLILVLVIGLILFNTVYLLLYCASKINHNALINENHKDCNQCKRWSCKNKRYRIFNFLWKYPLVSGIDIFLLVSILILFLIAIFHGGLVLWSI